MINHKQLRELVIYPTLMQMNMYSKEAEELLIFTCAVESEGGYYLKQINGAALGIYQMEPATYNDIWENYIKKEHSLWQSISLTFGLHRVPDESRLAVDLEFATLLCRLHYRRVQETLPLADNVDLIWQYYKQYYNTEKGKAEKDKSILAYHNFITH